MKALFFISVFLCISLINANSYVMFHISEENRLTLANANQDTEMADYNDVEALGQFLDGMLRGARAASVADDAVSCLKSSEASNLLNYYYGIASSAANSGKASAVDSVQSYLKTLGARYLKKLSKGATDCLAKSKDMKALEDSLKVSPSSDKFLNAFNSFANDNSAYFHSTFTNIYQAMNQGKFNQAGVAFGSYSRIAAVIANRD